MKRFVKNMLAGATGIDCFCWWWPRTEGVMPQTREHLTILKVLEIEAGCVITKSDLVEPEMLELVRRHRRGAEGDGVREAPDSGGVLEDRGRDRGAVGKLEGCGRRCGIGYRRPAGMQIDRKLNSQGFVRSSPDR